MDLAYPRSMDAVAGPFLAAASLLVAAGAGKVLDPQPLVRALRSARLPATPSLVRVFALGEVLLGLLAVVTGARAAAVGVALSYAAFSGFVLLARRRGGVLASCGCFGKDDTPPTMTHVVVTAGAAGSAAAVAARPIGVLTDVLAGRPELVLVTLALTVTAYLTLARLPLLTAARVRSAG